jgi:type IV pilus assembly protein PilC
MPSFSYIAKDSNGREQKGILSAENEKDFLVKMKDKALVPSTYKEVSAEDLKTIKKFNTKELVFITRQLSAMMTSGLTLVKSLDILTREVPGDKAKKVFLAVYEDVQKGESFSSALTAQKGAFPSFMISMVSAGESSGSLDVIMQRLSDHYAKEAKLANKIKAAMMYPIILGILCVVIVIGMFTFIMPTFAGMFENPDDMPSLTKAVMAFSNFLTTRWYVCVIIVSAVVFGIWFALRQPAIRYRWDTFIIKAPSIGPLVVKVYTGRFARTMSSLYSSGIPMVDCIRRASDILGNMHISDKFNTVIDEVKSGEPFSAAVQRTEIFESMFCSILYVGEESGALDDILERTSDYYEEESDAAIQRLVSLLEPLMIIIMGVAVGILVASVLPALYGSLENIE